MACSSRASSAARVKVDQVWLGLLLLALTVCASSGAAPDINAPMQPKPNSRICPMVKYMYPYWSVCQSPLRHFQAFHLMSGILGGLETGALEAELVVSFTGSSQLPGAAYYAVPYLDLDPFLGVPEDNEVVLVNSETKQPLTWTNQSTSLPGLGLVLTEASSSSGLLAAPFRFLHTGRSLPCPKIANARCEAYYLLSESAPQGVAPVNVSDGGPAVITPASEILESLTFLAILPSTFSFNSIKM